MKPELIRIKNPVRSSVFLGGTDILHNPALNKGTAFTEAERDALGLRGLLPPRVHTIEEQCRRILENLRRKPNDLERYIFMIGLQDRNETLFYRVVTEYLEEMLPIIYTPTVGQACQEYGHILRRSRGLFVSARDRGSVARVLRNWPYPEVRIVVVTDGERILGLGDLGANGMGIPVGKTSLYTACGGLDPSLCLPVTLDVGTENRSLREDPLYIGIREPRLRGGEYLELFDEFVAAVAEVFPQAVIQCEDFATRNAFGLLERYRDRCRLFNDDIQGTAAVILGGLYAAIEMTGGAMEEQRFLFVGAGEAGIGAGELVASALIGLGLPEAEARRLCWFVDSAGLVVRGRGELSERKRRFAHDHEPAGDLLSAVHALRPTALIGVCGRCGVFSKAVLEAMASINRRPIILALSNPTSNSECTAEEAYRWTGGRAVFASGSPFAPVCLGKDTHIPGQGTNVYIFPGVGLGAVISGASRITDRMFLAAARALSRQVVDTEREMGRIYPSLTRIREVSLAVAGSVAEVAYEQGLATRDRPADLARHIEERMYRPEYALYA
jgi:malate dehydrogenase (oxaloacetate-decarboxylating)(NADP+)